MFSKTSAYLHLPIKIVNYCETAIYCLMIVICVKVFDSSWEQLASTWLNTALVRWEQIVWHCCKIFWLMPNCFLVGQNIDRLGISGVLNIAIYLKTYQMFPYFAKQWFAWNTSSAKQCRNRGKLLKGPTKMETINWGWEILLSKGIQRENTLRSRSPVVGLVTSLLKKNMALFLSFYKKRKNVISSEICGVFRNAVSRWESGVSEPVS